ncbi:MAG: succinate dehydrogenase/fumarate reductase iron-sulfur subunit [Kouleothrix sp.]|nr:succinate dehydrogenase/fumarate reductase iron-sulfur subunit [Kouleothrix sp.]
MSGNNWTVTFQIYRQKGDQPPHFDRFTIAASPDEYVLDGVERVWAFHDRSLTFRHACHHSTCGACGMRVNGVEKLACITRIRDVARDGGTIKVEPLRNFPVVSDVVVDMSRLYAAMEQASFCEVGPAEPVQGAGAGDGAARYRRLADCIECGLCMSACPVAGTAPSYLGPGVLAALQQGGLDDDGARALSDSQDGIWRCHSAFECAAACPSLVDPATRIMQARRQLVGAKVRRLFRPGKEPRR